MEGLMMHCGAEAIHRHDLKNVVPLRGALGARHNPVPYIDFVDMVADQLNEIGFNINKEAFGITKDGDRFFGLMELESQYSDYAPMIGLRGSYDQSLPRGLVLGSGVFVCDNLCFSGEVNIKTKQTTNVHRRMPGLIHGAVHQIPNMIEHQHNKFEAYRNKEMKPRWGDAAIIELVRKKALAPSQVGKVIQEWDEPSHPEHAENGHSVWRFHNAVTESMKTPNAERAAVLTNMKKTQIVTSFLDEVVGL